MDFYLFCLFFGYCPFTLEERKNIIITSIEEVGSLRKISIATRSLCKKLGLSSITCLRKPSFLSLLNNSSNADPANWLYSNFGTSPMSSSCEYEMDNDEEIDTGLYSSSLPNSPTLPYIVSAASSLPKNSFFNPENNTLDSSQDEDTSTNQLSSQEEFHTKAEKVFICLHSKRNYTEDILGYGISVFISCKTGRIAKISNSIDYLSYTAFYKEGGRRSLTNEEFEFWLPLCKL